MRRMVGEDIDGCNNPMIDLQPPASRQRRVSLSITSTFGVRADALPAFHFGTFVDVSMYSGSAGEPSNLVPSR